MDSKSSDGSNGSLKIPPDHTASYQIVSLDDIDSAEQTFGITTRGDIEDLSISIEKTGLIQPPVLISDSNHYRIVCGFRRIAACRKLGWTHITASILGKTADRFETAQMAIADNAFQRSLNLVEISRALNLLNDFSPDRQQERKAARTLGLPFGGSYALEVKQICRLPLSIQKGILNGTINLSMAIELGRLNPSTAEGLLLLFDHLKVGLNRQRELLLLFREISSREDRAITDLITDRVLQEILSDAEMDRALKRQKVRSYLRRRRFPAITQAETDYRDSVRQLELGNNIKLIPPNDFEGNVFSMTLRFRNRRELIDLKKRIETIIENPALEKILDR